MSKAQLEAAQNLAAITGRPLSDFYKLSSLPMQVVNMGTCKCGESWDSDGVCHNEIHKTEQKKQEQEEPVEDEEQPVLEGSVSHVEEVRDSGRTPIIQTSLRKPVPPELLQRFNGKDVNGKLLHNKIQMTRKEYLAEKRKFKTEDEFYKSPLIYLMFRAEGQTEASFPNWTTSVVKEINK